MRRALVVGMGAAGLFASTLLSDRGWKVTAVGRGTPASALSTGCLRSPPGEWGGRLLESMERAGMASAAGDRTGISNLGTPFHCSMSPRRSSWAEGDAPRGLSVVGLPGHPSLRPALAVSMIEGAGMRAEALPLKKRIPADVPLASAFQEEDWEKLASLIRESREEEVLIPGFLPLSKYERLDWLEDRTGRRVWEAITPCGAPGQRFVEALGRSASNAGAVLWNGRMVKALRIKGGEAVSATVTGGLEAMDVDFDALLLASGGPIMDGVRLRGTVLEDPFAIFALEGSEDPSRGGYAQRNGHLVLRSGDEAVNIVGAGDCLAATERVHGDGLAAALQAAWNAVRALEGS